jgi:ankyrin repeat protein
MCLPILVVVVGWLYYITQFYKNDLCEISTKDDFLEVEKLIELGVDINKKDFSGNTPLLCAIKASKEKNAEILIYNQAASNYFNYEGETPLGEAIAFKQNNLARLLIKNGANVNLGRKYGSRPLGLAAINCNSEGAKMLIDFGADIDFNDSGYPPILLAARENCFSVFNILLEEGANVNVKDRQGISLEEFVKNKPIFQKKLLNH